MVRKYLGRLVNNAAITEEQIKKVKLTGSYDLNSMTLIFGLTSMSIDLSLFQKKVMDSFEKQLNVWKTQWC